jgi:photosystem II stability/assembly factor-like uncharacterized protein
MAQQTDGVLTGLTIGKDGAMYVTFKAGGAKWNTVGISPKGIFPPGANIAMAKQTNDILAALAVGNDGAMYVSWTAPGGWNRPLDAKGPGPYPPVPITPKGMFHPGSDIAMAKQTNNRLTAWAVGKDGGLYQSWVDGTGIWNKPVYPQKPGEPIPKPPYEPLFICCQGFFPAEQASIAAHKQTNDMLTILIVDIMGALARVQIDRLCNLEYCYREDRTAATISEPLLDRKSFGPQKLFPIGADIAMAQQADNLVSALALGNDGAMYVSWAVGGGEWQGPVGISPPKIFPPGAAIAMTKQTKDVLSALTVGNDGALYVSWIVGGGVWNKPAGATGPGPYPPVGISPKGVFSPGAGIAMVNFRGVLEALTAGKDGSIYVSWAAPRGWQGPVRIY